MTSLARQVSVPSLAAVLVVFALGALAPDDGAWAQSSLASFDRSTLAIETSAGETHDFDVELALRPKQQAQGLMFRRELAESAGMLFVYPSERFISMWMKNTLIPLDMLFVDSAGYIVGIAERTVPLSLSSISSGQPALGVLEVNAGTVRRLGIQPGDRILHPALGNAP